MQNPNEEKCFFAPTVKTLLVITKSPTEQSTIVRQHNRLGKLDGEIRGGGALLSLVPGVDVQLVDMESHEI